ncbi:MAG: aldo/keto reductase [Chloroflexi bacterium]|nr:aldo/keto reductase [Chloroflexota bacterium]
MKYRKLGATRLMVSEVGFGVWTVSTGWWGTVDESTGVRLLQEALGHGITLFDTADTYGEGLGETMLAKAFPKRRHDLVIATKVGYDFYTFQEREGHRERPQDFTPAFVRYACEQSLRRLRTEYIDLYQLHNPKMDALERDDLFALLDQLVREGKIRSFGVALGPDIGWKDEGLFAMAQRRVPAMQVIYSLLEPEPARAFFPQAEKHNTGLLARVPHASEVLTDKFSQVPAFPQGDHRALRRAQWLRQAFEKRQRLLFLAQGTGRTLAQAAIQFCLAQPTIGSVLPNITSREELLEYSRANEVPDLTPGELVRIDELLQHGFFQEQAGGRPAPEEAGSPAP